ncbi:MAG: hypothetical protein ACJA1P_002022, partial [Maribacter sp.]
MKQKITLVAILGFLISLVYLFTSDFFKHSDD